MSPAVMQFIYIYDSYKLLFITFKVFQDLVKMLTKARGQQYREECMGPGWWILCRNGRGSAAGRMGTILRSITFRPHCCFRGRTRKAALRDKSSTFRQILCHRISISHPLLTYLMASYIVGPSGRSLRAIASRVVVFSFRHPI